MTNKYLRFVIPVLTVCCIVMSCFVAPAHAADASNTGVPQHLENDLLIANNYSLVHWNSTPSQQSPTPSFDLVSGATSSAFRVNWDLGGASIPYSWLYFAVFSTRGATEVRHYMDDGTYKTASWEGQQKVTNGYITFYRVAVNKSLDVVSLLFMFSANYVGNFSILSCYGMFDTVYQHNKVDVYREDYYEISEGLEFQEATPVIGATLPYTKSINFPDEGYYRSNYRFIINGNDLVSPYVDRISFVFNTACTTISHHVSLIANDTNASNVTDLRVNLNEFYTWGASGDYFSGGGTFEYYKTFQLDVDLSGYSLTKYDILVVIGVEAIEEAYGFEPSYTDISFRSISYLPLLDENSSIKSFFSNLFNGLTSWLKNIYQSVVSFANDVHQSLFSFANDVRSHFGILFDKLEDYFGNDGSLAQAGDEMSQQAGQMQQANDSMNAVEKPTLDTGNLFGNYLDFDAGGLAILSCMTNNAYVTQCLVVVFTFALCGYVFFGKRR